MTMTVLPVNQEKQEKYHNSIDQAPLDELRRMASRIERRINLIMNHSNAPRLLGAWRNRADGLQEERDEEKIRAGLRSLVDDVLKLMSDVLP